MVDQVLGEIMDPNVEVPRRGCPTMQAHWIGLLKSQQPITSHLNWLICLMWTQTMDLGQSIWVMDPRSLYHMWALV